MCASTCMATRLHLYIWRISLLTLLLGCYHIEGKEKICDEKEKTISLLDVAEDLLSKAEYLYPLCMENSTDLNQTSCGTKDKSLTYLKLTKKLISEVKERFPTCEPFVKRHRDCSEILASGSKSSGVYTIWPMSRYTADKPVEVYCDMDTDGGGWTMIQRRGTFSPQESFFQDWRNYKVGFGKVTRDFWLGNDNIYALSNQGPCEIRFDLEDVRGSRRFAVYKNFRIEDENSKYTLRIGNYSGDAGDGMINHNGYPFSTKDRENTECANDLRGAWWFQDYAHVHLNGLHQPGVDNRENTHWYIWLKNVGLAKVEMKVRLR
ncbi:Techylectin-5A [Araneus ventricosus]|uniref:Techylectin-5A n=1 Tax=Araneus ventricosus TaxID=182803 RepID=A0A4Y2FGE1_ARAVE|nr:Techylectin-5A [Araneus ventricosus]